MDVIKSIGFLFGSDTSGAVTDTDRLTKSMETLRDKAAMVGLAFEGFDRATAGTRNYFRAAEAGYIQDEKVLKKLQAQIGEGFDTKGFEKFANAVQDSLGKSGTSILQQISQLKALGVSSESLKDASLAVTGLSGLGMSEGGAMRAVANYLQTGSSVMMNRYIPALRNATTEGEKQVIIQKAIQDGLKRQEAATDSYGGALRRWKDKQSDFAKGLAKLLIEGLHLKEMYNKLASAVQWLTKWMDQLSPKQKTIIASILGIIVVGVPMVVMFNKLSMVVMLFGSSLVKVALAIKSALIPTLLALLPVVAVVATAFAAWTLGETVGDIKVGTTTISAHVQIMCLAIQRWWDEMLITVEDKWRSFVRWISDTMKGFAGIAVSEEEYTNRIKEDEAYAIKKKQLLDLIRMRDELDGKSGKALADAANKKAIKSPEDFFNRLLENGGKNLEALKKMVVDSWDDLAGIFKLPGDDRPGGGNITPGGSGGKRGEGGNFSAALEKGTMAAYSFVINSSVQDRQLKATIDMKNSTLRQETLMQKLLEQGEETMMMSGEID